MSKNDLNRHLEDFFSDLTNHESPETGSAALPAVLSFSWETDANGCYLKCDASIHDALGYLPDEIIGNPFLSFMLNQESQKRLRDSLSLGSFPIEIELHAQAKNQELCNLRVTIFQKKGSGNEISGLRGYTQRLDLENTNLLDHEEQIIPKGTDNQEVETLQLDRNPSDLVHKTAITSPLTGLHTKSRKKTGKLQTADLKLRDVDAPANSTPDYFKEALTAPLSLSTLDTTIDHSIVSPTGISEMTGLVLSEGHLAEAQEIWSEAARTSLKQNVLVSTSASKDIPAVLAIPFSLRDQKSGLVEIISDSPDRKWTEEDRLLLSEVTQQLSLALENAQLYSTIQHELSERVKAERETLRRNKDLANLNQVGQQLSKLVSREQIFEIVSDMTQEIMGVDDLLISIFDDKTDQFSFPICIVNGVNTSMAPRELKEGYQENILKSKMPLFLPKDVASTLIEKQIDHSVNMPLSLMAVPLLAGNRSLGVLSIFDYQNEEAFDQVDMELISSIASQAATSLENANLFGEIKDALETIEVRQRLQANVTDAVAALTEKGSSEMMFFLECLSRATLCERVYFSEILPNQEGMLSWKTNSQFISNNTGLSNLDLITDKYSVDLLRSWSEKLRTAGWLAITLDTATENERTILSELNVHSLLFLAANISNNTLGVITLENHNAEADWQEEQVDILRIASDAFTNTLIRENLLNRLRTSLSETETLYAASHQLALADSAQEMIKALISGVSKQEVNRGVLVFFDYNLEGTLSRLTVTANYFSGLGTPPPSLGTEYLVSLYQTLFMAQGPVFMDEISSSFLDQSLIDIFIKENIRSLAVLPLWSANVQIGVLLLQSQYNHPFSPEEKRTYPPLVDQMATALQNLKLFESTQAALSETELLYKISSGIAKSTNLDDLVNLVGENVLPRNADSLWLFTVNSTSPSQRATYRLAGSYTPQGTQLPVGHNFEREAFKFAAFPANDTFVIRNIDELKTNPAAHSIFKNMGLLSAAVVPLQTANNPVGILIAGSIAQSEFDPRDVQTLKIVGNSIAVAIERQRLLSEAQRRALELQTAAEIARDTTSTLALDVLLSRIVNLLKDRFGFYHCSIFLLDESKTYAVVEESTGEAGLVLKHKKHKLAIGSKSVIGTCTATAKPVIVNDTSNSPIYYPNPLLVETRSELGIPLMIGGEVIGALDLQSTDTNAFPENELEVLQILSDQISVAIENARAFTISQQAVQDMRELDRVKSQFLANMSHELRTPLNSVIGFSRVILKGIDGPINEVQEQDINAIYNSGMNLLTMINEILDLSKIEAGKMELQLEDIAISDVINNAVSTATGLVKGKPVQLVQKVPANLPLVRADELKIGQVVLNLVSNAIKFTERGQVVVEATVIKNEQRQSELRVTVADSGVGIAPDDQAKLFQRFSQVDDSPTRKTGGTGLGLSISRSLIELHGGKIGLLSSTPGKGSVFFFALPVSDQPSVDLEQLTHGENVILSIDDDPQVIALYERYLKNYGFEVVALTNPAKALERARELKPFAITLDIMMPQVDGWQILHDLKQDVKTRDIPILVCSILEEEEKGFNLGASDYLVKPFLQDDLINAIRRINKDGKTLEVLVIDDDPVDLQFVKKMVEAEGSFHPTLAEGGAAAMEMLKTLTPDLIILDLFMPDMNGFDLLDKFKTEPRLSRIPVIILTGTDLTIEQQQQLTESSKALFTQGLLKESDILKNMEEALERIKARPQINKG